ncbi:formyltransferase family protein [Rhodovulum kholense]|uniref:Formyl transferase-like protein n=1 Tax=Rhodovulum kholense TaxID=453584 RepID=A0A8E2VLB8_9RHOB|nr:formyltransferase family protein [Rhodovulum kholense]PTW50382.1 formyl transferase-like protein [Rhodovulum kholense]
MRRADSVAFFGLRDDAYSEIALTHLETLFETVIPVLSTNEVPPTSPDPGVLETDWLFCFKSKTIFRAATLEGLGKAAINFHTSSPAYPGSGGVNWVLYNGDESSAITVHLMTADVDAGPILDVSDFCCRDARTVADLLKLTYRHHLLTFLRVTAAIARDGMDWVDRARLENTAQHWAPKTYRLRDLEDLKRLDPEMTEEEIARRIRATSFGRYGPFIELHGKRFTLSE